MADYWVSRGKYWCIYCKIHITDDKPSKQQHETGLKHKGNVERYVRDLYKKGEKDKKDKAEAASMMAQINAAAGDTSSLPSEPPAKKAKTSHSSDPYANYSTAATLGLVDEKAEQAFQQAQLERAESKVGEWSTVHKPVASISRAFEGVARTEDDDAELNSKHFAKERMAPVDLDDLYDPGKVTTFKKKTKIKKPDVKTEEDQIKTEENVGRPDMKGFKLAIQKPVAPKIKEESPSAS